MDTCGYIQEICNADFRNKVTDQERVIFFTSIGELVRDYEKYYAAGRTSHEKTIQTD